MYSKYCMNMYITSQNNVFCFFCFFLILKICLVLGYLKKETLPFCPLHISGGILGHLQQWSYMPCNKLFNKEMIKLLLFEHQLSVLIHCLSIILGIKVRHTLNIFFSKSHIFLMYQFQFSIFNHCKLKFLRINIIFIIPGGKL